MATATSGVLLSGHSTLRFGKVESSSSGSVKVKVSSELGFLTSQFRGINLSIDQFGFRKSATPISSAPLRPIARRVCPFTGKKANKANKVSFSNHKTKKLQFVNLQYKKVWWEAGNRYVKLRLSTKALKTIEKNGLDAVAKKAGIDLRKE
ncbi:Ribosomal protein L28 [Macleaya cordata]|uniref:Large ribosomal subunit protein bL28c n=1 Tax=Macleaya cordata TaxID=56857 RepID=A0A200Q1U7_MACCD|nr:Ribosomal protein L28 [Macleaya cordata]